MRFYTAHVDRDGRTRLLREGFSIGALIFGPLWFFAARAWTPAALLLAAELSVLALAPSDAALGTVTLHGAELAPIAWAVLRVLAAASARDLVRWSWRLHGFSTIDVVAARNQDAAWQRLLDQRPALAGGTEFAARPRAAR